MEPVKDRSEAGSGTAAAQNSVARNSAKEENGDRRNLAGKERSPVSKPVSRAQQQESKPKNLNRSVSVKSMNPLRKIFHRSQSHHEMVDRSRHAAGSSSPHGPPLNSDQKTRNRSSSFLQRMHPHHNQANQQHPYHQQHQTSPNPKNLHQSSSSVTIHNSKGHNVNPFITSRSNVFDSPFSALGKGSDIAAPRQPYINGSNPISRKTSSNESNMIYNPYGTLSKNNTSSSQHDLSFYLHDGKDELPLLPIPLKDPNEYLPEGYKQYSVQLADNFAYPEKNSADDLNLGSGGSSDVRTVRSAFHKKELYALKKFKLLRNEKPDHFYQRCSKEFIMAKRLSKNPHIANTFYLVKVSTTTFMTRGWAFVMEYCTGGDLYSLITKPNWKKRPLSEKFEYWRQVVEGIKFIHSQGIVHRDIKPENVLITNEGLAKLTDFGISEWGHENPDDLESPVKLFDTYVGSPPYTSPEVMCFNDDNATKQDLKPYDAYKMDCWALGVLLFTLVYQSTPFMEAYKTDSRFRSYVLAYDNFVDHNNPQFRKPGTYKSGPGSEFQFGREFQNTNASRVAWRLADPDAKTRYTIDDIVADPWWASISANAHESSVVVPKMPELRNSSYESNNENSILATPPSARTSEEDLTHTSNPFLVQNNKNKSKSMLSIAEVPPAGGAQAMGGESLPTLNEEKVIEENGSGVESSGKTERVGDESAGEKSMEKLSLGELEK
ncbi:LANO_0F15302g1_1 [Lachancea nothofagi CBS 11611]|uniref:LANO_0F15302g1_1 n=1 Tax=Lachancea nothofagi CBS 11611 TaxID=1266666 RepID=A0A1G4KCH3_9SACH|nr:LANO_0F15302g1_1 [Lachancea nothofagi CBS 11611]